MDIKNAKTIYMIGIKGVGMTMLAQFLSATGHEVSGSDVKEKFMTDQVLEKAGIKVIEGFGAENIPTKVDLIIYSTSYNVASNPEVAVVFERKLAVLTYAEALAQVFNSRYGIAVVGSHGKTTTSAWLGYVLDQAGLSPSVLVGARVPQFDGASLIGKSEYLVAELDEYQNKLQYFSPQAVLLNNIEYDHPDFFPTPNDYNQVFIEFIKKIPTKGFLVANLDDPIIKKTIHVNTRAKIITYSLKEAADYVAYNIKSENNKQYFKVKIASDEEDDDDLAGTELGDFVISLIGKHNVYNALAVIAACIELNLELSDIRKYLEEFTGTARRAEIMGKYQGALIIDDYAHHPTEIKATLAGIRVNYPSKNLKIVFHPHTFTRTRALFNEFAASFSDADEVIVLDIYGSAREKQGGVSSAELAEAISQHESRAHKPEAKHISTLEKCEEYLRKNLNSYDVLVLMGAGDVFRIGEGLITN